jgi:hypothetical protein
MDISSTTSIRKIVNKARSRGRIPESRDAECYQLVIDGMKDLSLFTLPHKNTVKITVDSLGRIQLPSDYLMFVAVGLPLNGMLYTFTRNNLIVQSSDKTYAYEAYDTAYGENQSIPIASTYTYSSSGGTNDTYFIINERLRYIQLIDFVGTEATLVYVSNGIAENADGVEIPLVAEEALIAYVLWMIVQYDPAVPIQISRERERLYGDACLDINRVYSPTVDEILDNYYSTLTATIKR